MWKSIFTVPSLLKRWKRLQSAMDLSAEAFESLTMRFENHTKKWLKMDKCAQRDRSTEPCAMDIYDTSTKKRMYLNTIDAS